MIEQIMKVVSMQVHHTYVNCLNEMFIFINNLHQVLLPRLYCLSFPSQSWKLISFPGKTWDKPVRCGNKNNIIV